MNRDKALEYLRSLLGDFILSDELISELVDLICKSGYEKSVFQLFITRLKFLNQLGINATQSKEFELIGGGIYSMHLTGSGFNIRILYSFSSSSEPTLLHAFYEKQGNVKTEYPVHVKIAQDRLEILKKDD